MQELIKRLRNIAEYEADLADESKWERIEWEAADLIESQAAEIDEYVGLNNKLSSILTSTANALKGEPLQLHLHSWHDLADVALDQAAEIAKYRALCDQMSDVMTKAVEYKWPYLDDMRSITEAWRAME